MASKETNYSIGFEISETGGLLLLFGADGAVEIQPAGFHQWLIAEGPIAGAVAAVLGRPMSTEPPTWRLDNIRMVRLVEVLRALGDFVAVNSIAKPEEFDREDPDQEAARFAEAVGLAPDSDSDLEQQFFEVPSFLRRQAD